MEKKVETGVIWGLCGAWGLGLGFRVEGWGLGVKVEGARFKVEGL